MRGLSGARVATSAVGRTAGGDGNASTTLRGANFVGSPNEVIEKILYQHGLFNHQRLLLQLSVGTLPHAAVMRAVELLGTVVAPAVRKALAG